MKEMEWFPPRQLQNCAVFGLFLSWNTAKLLSDIQWQLLTVTFDATG